MNMSITMISHTSMIIIIIIIDNNDISDGVDDGESWDKDP